MNLFNQIKHVLTTTMRPAQFLDDKDVAKVRHLHTELNTIQRPKSDIQHLSEEILIRAEMFKMSPKEVLRQEAKRQLYERIVYGSRR
jgi:hypothetical protein